MKMKKLFCFLAIGALTLTSCSSSSDDDGGSGVVLLKKTIETDSDGNTFTSQATYNGTKISKITADGGFVLYFTYTGDLITKIEYKLGGVLIQTDSFSYDGSQRLISYVRLEHDDAYGAKELYVHNGDDSIGITAYSGDLTSQTTLDGTGTITFLANGEVGTITTDFSDSHTYTYDTKNNPFKNVTGYSKISWVDASATGILHNITSDDSSFDTTTTTYTYNSGDYPTEAVETSGVDQATTTFFYN
jgi:hypothetical protein